MKTPKFKSKKLTTKAQTSKEYIKKVYNNSLAPFDSLRQNLARKKDGKIVNFRHLSLCESRRRCGANAGCGCVVRRKTATVGEILHEYNQPQWITENHQWYLEFTAVGAGDNYIGAEVLAGWYNRNIRIFANLRRRMAPSDRILLIIGAGHLAILHELTRSCNDIELVNSLDYL